MDPAAGGRPSWEDATLPRCSWLKPSNPAYVRYHDTEWCRPHHDEGYLYELFVLELFQAGLSWETILNKREAFRSAYAGFDVDAVAGWGPSDIDRLMQAPGIIHHRRKIEASIGNAQAFKAIQREFSSFDAYLWGFTDGTPLRCAPSVTRNELSDALAADLKRRGVTFAGSVTMFSYLQATGVVNSHDPACFCAPERMQQSDAHA
jgi:DNA-3-methyladenine glycosylase I